MFVYEVVVDSNPVSVTVSLNSSLISFQSSRINGELRAFSNLLLRTSTANSNTVFTLTSPSTITATAISSVSGIVGINPIPAISLAATGQDAHFETSMENTKFKLGSTLEKFITTNNPPGKSRGENYRGYLASRSEIDQSSDHGSNCVPPP